MTEPVHAMAVPESAETQLRPLRLPRHLVQPFAYRGREEAGGMRWKRHRK